MDITKKITVILLILIPLMFTIYIIQAIGNVRLEMEAVKLRQQNMELKTEQQQLIRITEGLTKN